MSFTGQSRSPVQTRSEGPAITCEGMSALPEGESKYSSDWNLLAHHFDPRVMSKAEENSREKIGRGLVRVRRGSDVSEMILEKTRDESKECILPLVRVSLAKTLLLKILNCCSS